MPRSTKQTARRPSRPRRPPTTETESRQILHSVEPPAPQEPDPRATRTDGPTAIYRDSALRVLLVVEHGGALWLVPRRPDGWSNRSSVTMTHEARAERLRPARDVTLDWLGIGAQADREPRDFDGDEQNRADLPRRSSRAPVRPDAPQEQATP